MSGHEIAGEVVLDVLDVDGKMFLRNAWGEGQAADGRKFELCQVIGGAAICLGVGNHHYLVELGGLIQQVLDIDAARDASEPP